MNFPAIVIWEKYKEVDVIYIWCYDVIIHKKSDEMSFQKVIYKSHNRSSTGKSSTYFLAGNPERIDNSKSGFVCALWCV